MKNKIYLDNNATTPAHAAVVEAMMPYLWPKSGLYGNPSSVHTLGQLARKAVEDARAKVARLIGATPDEIVFTSCGSESDTTAVKGAAFAAKERGKGNHLITSAIEHDTVLFCCQYLQKMGFELTVLPVDRAGRVNPDELEKAVRADTILVSIMHANNEIGTIQPIEKISRICRERGILFHTDAVQTVGKIPVQVGELGVDMLSLSAHKFYGPKGVGALYIRKGTRLHPLFHGHHERNRRAGTENVPGIAGLGMACELAGKNLQAGVKHITALRERLEKGILKNVPYAHLNGGPDGRIPNTSNFSFEYVEGEGCVVMMDMEGVAVSTGSACASGTTKVSHVLRALGIPTEIAQGSVRFSLGHQNTEHEIDRVVELVPDVVQRLRSLSPIWSDRMQSASGKKP